MLISITVKGSQLRPSLSQEEVSLRPLRAGEKIEFGDYVQLTPFPDFSAGTVVHGRKITPYEGSQHKFWRKL